MYLEIIEAPIEVIESPATLPAAWQNWEIKGFRNIRPILTVGSDRFASVELVGSEFRSLGMLDGDQLVFRITRVYEPARIGIWQTPRGRFAKFAVINHDGTVRLMGAAGSRGHTYPGCDVFLLGLVVRIERDLGPLPLI